MLSLLSPAWLLGLGILPLIRWLHRFHDARSPLPVSALFLWRTGQQAESAGRLPARPDPRWRLRALFFASLLLTLAGPHWNPEPEILIEVWIDDSLSMFASESGDSRMHTGLRELVTSLQGADRSVIRIRSLSNPAVSLQLDASPDNDWLALLDAWTRAPRGRPAPPPAVQMDTGAEHWLVTDGADKTIDGWLQSAPISRVIQVGHATDNVAVTRLAVRPALEPGELPQAMVTVSNTGEQTVERRLTLLAGGKKLQQWNLSLAAATAATRIVPLADVSAPNLRASLAPGDALRLDDELQLELKNLAPVAVRLYGSCGKHLRKALYTHPRLAVGAGNAGSYDLGIACGLNPAALTGPALRIHTPQRPQGLKSAAYWLSGAGDIRWPDLDPEWLYSDAAQPQANASTALLSSAGTTLITASDAAQPVVDIFLDLENISLVRQPEYPALVDALIGYALNRRLLTETIHSEHPLAESYIAPRPLAPAVKHTQAAQAVAGSIDLSPYIILLGILLLLGDILLVSRCAGHAAISTSRPG